MLNEILTIVEGLTDAQFIAYLVAGIIIVLALAGFIISFIAWRRRLSKKDRDAAREAKAEKKAKEKKLLAQQKAAKAKVEVVPVAISEESEVEAEEKEDIDLDNFVSADTVNDLLSDEQANALIEEVVDFSPKCKDIIYWIDLSKVAKYFMNGETVTLDEIKRRIPKVPRCVTYLKVVADGTLNKKFTVVANSYSKEAVKMILLMGGKVQKITHVKIETDEQNEHPYDAVDEVPYSENEQLPEEEFLAAAEAEENGEAMPVADSDMEQTSTDTAE